MRPAWYNEIDPYAAEWLRRLISAGHLPPGDVDERDIRSVQPADLAGYGQCHFFAGIGGFALACRLAGWPDDRPIWTGGFPCQPFSVAGRQLAAADDRHLWPELHRLVARCRPAAFLGENVAGLVKLALDGVQSDLEAAGYASRAFVLPACAVDAPHRRDRVWVVAKPVGDADGARLAVGACEPSDAGRERPPAERAGDGAVADGAVAGRQALDGDGIRDVPRPESGPAARCGGAGALADADDAERRADGAGGHQHDRTAAGRQQGDGDACQRGGGFWDGAGWVAGRDGKQRRVAVAPVRRLDDGLSAGMAGVRPIPLLEKGVPDRVQKLKAFGNAIVPAVAAEILKAMMHTMGDDDAR